MHLGLELPAPFVAVSESLLGCQSAGQMIVALADRHDGRRMS
jgi:hypothetical protein